MAERLVDFDVQEILEKSKKILREKRRLPEDCPSEKCLSLKSIKWRDRQNILRIFARPPELPTKKEGLLYEIHDVCRNRCQILGNKNFHLMIKQNTPTGDIVSITTELSSGHY